MPRLKPLDRYPPEYQSAFDIAYETGEHRISCSTFNEAAILRTNLYAYRRAIGADPASPLHTEWPRMKKITLSIDGVVLVLSDPARVATGLGALRNSLPSGEHRRPGEH